MSLAPGVRLGAYDIVALIGAGGMGEVYRARDTRLKREVAIKILPEAFANDPDRLARFQREAELLASLNFPHIAQIYGLEHADGIHALILELVDGPTLADRIAQGPIPVNEALPIARQIAEALEAAHERGVIHRDLKPANIKLTADGSVKVLDFGLAKLADQASGSGLQATGQSHAQLSHSPTITSPALMTGAHVILGTAAYMSPEQARGKPVDRRSDVWAFGCVLYEMLTGKRAFDGDDLTDTIASIVKLEPDWSALPADVPSSVRTLVQRCLAKDRKQRIAEMGTALFILNELPGLLLAAPTTQASSASPSRARLTGATVAGIAIGATVAAALAIALMRSIPTPTPRSARFAIATSESAPFYFALISSPDVAMSPDGSRFVYTAGLTGSELMVRAIDQLEAMPLRGITQPRSLFMSPDGNWIGFITGGELKKVSVTGGPSITLCRVGANIVGASWAGDNAIVFATIDLATGLLSVPAAGGEPRVLTKPEPGRGEQDHLFPFVLPGGQAVLFTVRANGSSDSNQIAVLDLKTGQHKIIIRGGSQAAYLPSGHVIYASGGALRAVRFDLTRLDVVSDPAPVVDRILTKASGAAAFAVSDTGTLVYVPGEGSSAGRRTLVWVDRTGKEDPLPAPARAYGYAAVSPDGEHVALFSQDEQQDIWLFNQRSTTLTRLTTEPGTDNSPVWTPDGGRIIYGSVRSGRQNLWMQAADGTGAPERLTTSDYPQVPTGMSPDGSVIFSEITPTGGFDLVRLSLTGDRKPIPLLQTSANERNGTLSPDGRWLAYQSNTSGRDEIYVRPFPTVQSGLWQVSTAGGTRPLWARSGKELFFIALDGAVMRVGVDAAGTTWSASTPTKLFSGPYLFPTAGPLSRSYDVSPDGRRFLMIKTSEEQAAPPSVVVVEHFDEELKRLVPTK